MPEKNKNTKSPASSKRSDGTKIFALPRIQRHLQEEASDDINQFVEVYRTNTKRNFSQLSAISAQSADIKHQKLESNEISGKEYISNRIEILEQQQDTMNKLIQKVNKEWQDGHIDATRSIYLSQMELLEIDYTNLCTDLIVLRTSKNELRGRLIDQVINERDQDILDWSQLDPLIRLYKMPEGARLTLFSKREASAQDRFRAGMLKAYNALANKEVNAWCVISGEYYKTSFIRAAHIVRYNLGEPTAKHIFGPSEDKDGHIMGAKNSLPIHRDYEELFDQGKLVIVPDGPGPGCWKTQLLYDEDVLDGQDLYLSSVKSKLENRPLQFKNDFRPASRYLYFAYCMNILRHQRHNVPGWWKDRLGQGPGAMFATPGAYLRTSTLRTMARRVGHLTEDESFMLSGESKDKAVHTAEDEEQDNIHSEIASQASMKKSAISSPWASTLANLNIRRDVEDEEEENEEQYYQFGEDDGDVFTDTPTR